MDLSDINLQTKIEEEVQAKVAKDLLHIEQLNKGLRQSRGVGCKLALISVPAGFGRD